jgi:PAS domain S-box-containing protein
MTINADPVKREKVFGVILNAVDAAVIIVDSETHKVADVNDAAVQLFGVSKKNIVGMLCHKFVCPNEISQCPITDQGKIIHKAKKEFTKPSGEKLPILKTVSRVTINNRIYLVETLVDITARAKAEAKLVESELKYRYLSELTTDYVYSCVRTKDMTYQIDWISGAFENITGYSIEQIMNKGCWLTFIHPADAPLIRDYLLKLKPGQSDSCEYRIVTGNGSIKWIHDKNLCIVHESDPQQLRLLGGAQDITERKQVEEALKASEEKYRSLFEESRDVVFISIPEGKFLDINPAGIELFGYSSKEKLMNIDINNDLYVNPEDRKQYQKLLIEKGYVKDYATEMRKASGEKLNVLVTSSTVKDKTGNIVAYRGIIRDITESKSLESQLLHSQKMEAVGQLAGGVAHDFNNILTAIMGYCNLIQMKTQEDLTRTRAEHILALSEKAAGLTQSLLAFSRKQVINPLPTNINELVNSTSVLLRRLIGGDIELKTELSKQSILVIVDKGQIEHVLMNLATNAKDAMPHGGTMTINTECIEIDKEFIELRGYGEIGKYARLSVADTGIGIDENTRERIFEPFFTTKEVGKGSGLGLAIVYGIIKQHNGFVNVRSGPDQGTTVSLYIPAA